MNHVSVVRKASARQNIEVKLNVLRSWITQGIPIDVSSQKPEFAPVTLRQFKTWDGSQNTDTLRAQLPQIRRVGNDTLDNNADLKNAALSLMALLRTKLASSNDDQRSAKNNLLQLTAELKELLRIRNAEVVEQQREIHRLKRLVATLERRLAAK
ncbi:TPA: hypothetical protein QEK98_000225 [Stenotrophomonas maltophilia]|nr:hypothetical protein [Stenotrophomonas maltophilia]